MSNDGLIYFPRAKVDVRPTNFFGSEDVKNNRNFVSGFNVGREKDDAEETEGKEEKITIIENDFGFDGTNFWNLPENSNLPFPGSQSLSQLRTTTTTSEPQQVELEETAFGIEPTKYLDAAGSESYEVPFLPVLYDDNYQENKVLHNELNNKVQEGTTHTVTEFQTEFAVETASGGRKDAGKEMPKEGNRLKTTKVEEEEKATSSSAMEVSAADSRIIFPTEQTLTTKTTTTTTTTTTAISGTSKRVSLLPWVRLLRNRFFTRNAHEVGASEAANDEVISEDGEQSNKNKSSISSTTGMSGRVVMAVTANSKTKKLGFRGDYIYPNFEPAPPYPKWKIPLWLKHKFF